MRLIFEDAKSKAVLLVNASNAFNSLNCREALQNIHILCPPLSIIVTNTYRDSTELFIDGETLQSCKRATQGEPLTMAMYAIGILLLIHQIQCNGTKQVWFTDNATAGGKLHKLLEWWTKLCGKGPSLLWLLHKFQQIMAYCKRG